MKSIEHTLLQAYTTNIDIIAEGLPMRINSARGGCMESFMLSGLPDAKNERFLQNDMRELFGREEREIYFTPPRFTDRFTPIEGMGAVVVAENGFSDGMFAYRDDGVVLGSLRGVFAASEGISGYYNSVADNGGDALTALNSAFTQDGAVVYVPDGVDAGKILIDNRFSSEDEAQFCLGRTLIVLGEGAKADVTAVYRSRGDTRFLIDHVREAVVGKNATLLFSEINLLGGATNLLLNSYVRQDGKSHTKSIFVASGLGDVRFSLKTELAGEFAQSDLWALYLASGRQNADIELRTNHLAADCRSNQLVKGIAAAEATGIFTGMVFVAQNAQRTNAGQQNRNLQLDDTAHIYTRPQLEIYADDVKCGHGATVGQLDQDAIYYMRQRGISEHEARRMQIEGFVNDIIGRSDSEQFREYASTTTAGRINKF